VKKTVITLSQPNGSATVEAYVDGFWAAHCSIGSDSRNEDNEPLWNLTHVPTGKSIVLVTGYLDKSTALRCAVALGRNVPAATEIEAFEWHRVIEAVCACVFEEEQF
jgi:hypothetical protein